MQPTLKLVLLIVLGFWLGTSIFFSFVAAPELFALAKKQVITREQAGDVARALLQKYFITGTIVLTLALVLCALLAFGTGRPRFTRCAIILFTSLVITLFDGFVWGPKVHETREERRAHPSAKMDKKFGKMHAISFGLNVFVIVGTFASFVTIARQE
jgi:hypothetical protein